MASAPPPDRSVRRSIAWTFIGRLAQAVAQAGLLILAARLGSAEVVGDLAVAMAICSPIMVIVGLQQRVVYVTDVERRFGWRTHVRLRRWAALVGVVVAASIASTPWVHISVGAVLAIALAKAGDLSSDLHHATFQTRGAMRLYARSVSIRAVAGLIALGVALQFAGSLALGLLAMAAVSWAVALAHDAPLSRSLRTPSPGRDGAMTLLWTAAPLGVVTFVDSLTQHAVRLQVDGLLGTTALGHYAVMSYVVIAGGAVVFSLGTPLLRPMAEQYASGRTAAFVRTVLRLAGLGVLLGAFGIAFAVVFGEVFLGIVFGDTFVAHADVFPWVMAAGALHFVLNALMHAVNAAQRRRAQPWIFVAALALTLLAGWAWVPSNGLRGAAQASALGWLVALVITAVVLGRAIRRRAA